MSLENASALLVRVFEILEVAGYVSFFQKGRSKRQAIAQPFIPEHQSVRDLLVGGQNRRDVGKQQIPELGFSFGLWSGGSEENAYELTGQLGNATNIGKNCLVLRLPQTGALSLSSNSVAIEAMFTALVSAVEPHDAIVCDGAALTWEGNTLAPKIRSFMRYRHAA